MRQKSLRQNSDDFEDDSRDEFILRLLDFVANFGTHQLAHDLAGDALQLLHLGVEVVRHGLAVDLVSKDVLNKHYVIETSSHTHYFKQY